MTVGGTYVFGIVAAVVAVAAVVELMRRGTLRERHALWWMVGAALALIIAVFPQTLRWASHLFGIAIPLNLIFFVAIGLLFLVNLQYGAELTRTEDKMRTLAEHTAFLEQRVRDLEAAHAVGNEQKEGEGSAPDRDADVCAPESGPGGGDDEK